MPEKLVRDLIPDLIRASGQEPILRTADRCEYLQLLGEKLTEEVGEYLTSDDPAELADVAEALFALADALNVDLDELRARKLIERGGFGQRLVWCGNREVGDG